MKIIFIHGINQQNFDSESFQHHWLSVFNLGIHHTQPHVDTHKLNLSFPFYGDILNEFEQRNAIDPDTLKPNWRFFNRLPQFRIEQQRLKQPQELPLLPHYAKPFSMKNRFSLLPQWAKDRILKEMVILLNHFPNLHESLVQRFVSEAYLYWYNAEFKEKVHQRIMASFEPNQQHIVIAHSLGSVIAYNILHQLAPNIEVNRFITLASPLPFQVVQRHLVTPVSRPKTLTGDWYNFYAQDDYLTTFPMTAPLFDFIPAVKNQRISTFIDRPHAIIGYLQHPSVIQRILECHNANLDNLDHWQWMYKR
ncbi:MAG: hypothetical protein QM666_01735 [Acinetobacter sp.]